MSLAIVRCVAAPCHHGSERARGELSAHREFIVHLPYGLLRESDVEERAHAMTTRDRSERVGSPARGAGSRSARAGGDSWGRTKLTAARRWERFAPEIAAATGWQVWNPGLYGERWHRHFRAAYPLARAPLAVFGLNPGPYGMAQSGIPFTDLKRVAERLPRLAAELERRGERLVLPGLAPRSLHPYLTRTFESSAVRVYRFLELGWGSAEEAFRHVVVANPCSLLFMEPTTRKNRTPADLVRVVRARGTHDARVLQAEMARLRWRAAEESIRGLAPRAAILFGRDVAEVLSARLAEAFPALPVIAWEHPARAVPETWARGLLDALRERGLLG